MPHFNAVFQAKEKDVKIIDEDGLFSLINAAPAPDAALDEEAPPPASISGTTMHPGPAAAPSPSGRSLPASFSGRVAASAPAAAPSRTHAGVPSWATEHHVPSTGLGAVRFWTLIM